MSEPVRSVNVVNIATGICFVAFGVLLLLQRAGTLEMRQIVELWPLVLVVVGGAVVWQASRGGDMRGSGACAGWLFWVVVLGLVFSHAYDRRSAVTAAGDSGTVNMFAVMSGDRRSPQDGMFSGGTVTTVLGGTHLDLTRASLAPGETAVVDVFTALGGTEIRIPGHWRVDIQTTTVAGGVTDERARGSEKPDDTGAAAPDDPAVTSSAANQPRLVIQGVVFMAGVTIK
jgi:hypothetical protein